MLQAQCLLLLSGGDLLCLLLCSLHARVMVRDKQSGHYCVTQYRKERKKKKASKTKPKTTNPANLVLRQGKIKLFLFFKNTNEIMVLYGYVCHPRRMIPLRLKQRLLFANNL